MSEASSLHMLMRTGSSSSASVTVFEKATRSVPHLAPTVPSPSLLSSAIADSVLAPTLAPAGAVRLGVSPPRNCQP